MNIYFIEDNPLKASLVIDFLGKAEPSMAVEMFESFQSGLRACLSSPPDLLLLDMTLPTFDRRAGSREGRLRPIGGYELMRKLVLHGIPFRAIVITQLEAFGEGIDRITYEEMNNRCLREFVGSYLGGVRFEQTNTDWQSQLIQLIQNVKPDEEKC